MNLRMNSLEDAFVNIGMDEERFLKRAKRSLSRKSNQYSQLEGDLHEEREPEPELEAPECLKWRTK